MEQYHILERIGEGAHGVVLKAKHLKSGELVALKKIPMKKLDDGIPNSVLREMKALQECEDCHHVIRLRDVFPHGPGFVLVFDYMLSDLAKVIRNTQSPLTWAQVKTYMIQLLKGVNYLHTLSIMHRDLKPANLLISPMGHLKIADFGLSRVFSGDNGRLYSHQVATRWYRAPELLYGAKEYDLGVDMWAVGCIFGELLNNSPLFPGENDIDQLCRVLRILGTPTEDTWPNEHPAIVEKYPGPKLTTIERFNYMFIHLFNYVSMGHVYKESAHISMGMSELPDFNKILFPHMLAIPLEEVVPEAPTEAIQLLSELLVYHSKKRISASNALLHPYFFTPPLPAPDSELPIPSSHSSLKNMEDFDPLSPIENHLVKPHLVAAFANEFVFS